MLAETVQQENHFFSLSTGTTVRKPIIIAKTAPVIIIPEMANAVICPDTGKSLKHQESGTRHHVEIHNQIYVINFK
jgi:hypothetical protein